MTRQVRLLASTVVFFPTKRDAKLPHTARYQLYITLQIILRFILSEDGN
jgi:hypothetical protein